MPEGHDPFVAYYNGLPWYLDSGRSLFFKQFIGQDALSEIPSVLYNKY